MMMADPQTTAGKGRVFSHEILVGKSAPAAWPGPAKSDKGGKG
jgi:hypothetical protein